MSVREFIEAIASDNSLRNACIFMNQNGYLPSCVNQNHGAILEKIIASTGELDEVLVSKWLQAAKVPEFLLKHYWRAISSFSQNNKVGAYQIFFALCAITAPHEGVWRDIRDRYIFAAFDSDGNQQLDLLEFRIFVYSILFTSGMDYSETAVNESTTRIAKKMKCTNPESSGKLDRQDWIQSEQERLFPCCESFFRLPISLDEFIKIIDSPSFFASSVSNSSVQVNIKANGIHIDRTDDQMLDEGISMQQSSRIPIAAFKKVQNVEKGLFSPDEERNQNSILLGEVSKLVIRKLLCGTPSYDSKGFSLLSVEQMYQLCIATRDILKEESNIVYIDPPCRVFGDIRGHLKEILGLFKTFGSPNHYTGDVELSKYVFNGNFIDCGKHSLDVICLLFSMKVLYPKQVYLIRGNHEDSSVNSTRGFREECLNRINSEYGEPLWELFNHVFGFLPVGSIIGHKILCVHGGIGPSFTNIPQIQQIPKPIVNTWDNPMIREIIWAQTTSSDLALNTSVKQSEIKFDKEQVIRFCIENGLELLIRSNECVPCGYEFFSGGHLITIFSATNYLNNGNSGACLTISPSLSVRAKSISPATLKSIQ